MYLLRTIILMSFEIFDVYRSKTKDKSISTGLIGLAYFIFFVQFFSMMCGITTFRLKHNVLQIILNFCGGVWTTWLICKCRAIRLTVATLSLRILIWHFIILPKLITGLDHIMIIYFWWQACLPCCLKYWRLSCYLRLKSLVQYCSLYIELHLFIWVCMSIVTLLSKNIILLVSILSYIFLYEYVWAL